MNTFAIQSTPSTTIECSCNGSVAIAISRTGDLSIAETVPFNIGGTATYGVDYSFTEGATSASTTSGSVTFQPGQSVAILRLRSQKEKIQEGDETIILSLPSNTSPSNSTTVTILDERILTGTDLGETIAGGLGRNSLSGGRGDDVILGQLEKDELIGGFGTDTLTGGAEGDEFIFSGPSAKAALKTSTVKQLDRITDFKFSESDRFELDFDNNLVTQDSPRKLFHAGDRRGNLEKVLKKVYQDHNSRKQGDQSLKAGEAVFFNIGSRTYLSVNDNKAKFSANRDLVADVTGLEFKAGNDRVGALQVTDYFV
jgi:hypothetical protein